MSPINASETYTWHYTFRVRLGPAFLLAFVKSYNFLAVNLNNQKNLKAELHILLAFSFQLSHAE